MKLKTFMTMAFMLAFFALGVVQAQTQWLAGPNQSVLLVADTSATNQNAPTANLILQQEWAQVLEENGYDFRVHEVGPLPASFLDSLKSASAGIASDTIRYLYLGAAVNKLLVQLTDLAGADSNWCDSVQAYVSAGWDTTYWSKVTFKSVQGDSVYLIAEPMQWFPKTQETQLYQINLTKPYWVKLVLTNKKYISGRLVPLRYYTQ
jgi:hypothetical protein